MNDELARMYGTHARASGARRPIPARARLCRRRISSPPPRARAVRRRKNPPRTPPAAAASTPAVPPENPPPRARRCPPPRLATSPRSPPRAPRASSRSREQPLGRPRREEQQEANKRKGKKGAFGEGGLRGGVPPRWREVPKGRLGERTRGTGTFGRVEGDDEGDAGGAFAPSAPRDVRLGDLGGIEESLRAIRELILCPLTHPELYTWLGVDPPRGVLLHGPPGCGKTTLAHAIAREAGVPFFCIAAPEIVAGVSGESERKSRRLFAAAAAAAPSIVFIDEVDAIVPKRDGAQRQMESASSRSCSPAWTRSTTGGTRRAEPAWRRRRRTPRRRRVRRRRRARRAHVTVIGATNRPDAIDTALRRAGRFDREIMLGIPDEAARGRILAVQARRLRMSGNLDLAEIARKTPGYVGADLSALAKEAAALAVSRIFDALAGRDVLPVSEHIEPRATPSEDVEGDTRGDDRDERSSGEEEEKTSGALIGGRLADRAPLRAGELAGLAITAEDFSRALTRVQPSAQREGFTTTPEVTWEDVGSLTEVREELAFSVVEPIAHPKRFHAMGLAASTGVLLYGPPGCGKTLVAKATANEASANFISIKGPELLNKYVGESERAVRVLFARARAASPCVLFFDELDSLAPRRGGEGNQASERVVNQLLTEMDGLESRSATFVVAATNRPDMIDPAMLRPGRLDKLLYVPLPPPDGRAAILATLTRKTPLAPEVDVAAIAASARCGGFSGADLASLVREACVAALKGNMAAFARRTTRRRARRRRLRRMADPWGRRERRPRLRARLS